MHKVMIMATVKKGKTGYGYMGIDKAYAPKEREEGGDEMQNMSILRRKPGPG